MNYFGLIAAACIASAAIGWYSGSTWKELVYEAQRAEQLAANAKAEKEKADAERKSAEELERQRSRTTSDLLAALERARRGVRITPTVPTTPTAPGQCHEADPGAVSAKDREDVERRLSELWIRSSIAAAEADECALALEWWQTNRGRSP